MFNKDEKIDQLKRNYIFHERNTYEKIGCMMIFVFMIFLIIVSVSGFFKIEYMFLINILKKILIIFTAISHILIALYFFIKQSKNFIIPTFVVTTNIYGLILSFFNLLLLYNYSLKLYYIILIGVPLFFKFIYPTFKTVWIVFIMVQILYLIYYSPIMLILNIIFIITLIIKKMIASMYLQ